MMKVECHDKEFAIWYPATIVSFAEDDTCLVEYDGEGKEPEKKPRGDIRLAPSGSAASSWGLSGKPGAAPKNPPAPSDRVEVRTRMEPNLPFGWISGTIVEKMGPGAYEVSYDGWEDEYNEIKKLQFLRRPNKAGPVPRLEELRVKVPDGIHAFCKQGLANHDTFCQNCELASVSYDAAAHSLVLLGTKEAIDEAGLLVKFHLDSLKEQKKIKDKQVRMRQEINDHKEKESVSMREEVTIEQHLMGLAIGKKGINLMRARACEGVHDVSVLNDRPGTFAITGESKEAIQTARDMLEYIEDRVEVDQEYLSRVLGKKWSHLQEIIDASDVAKMTVEDTTKTRSTITILGTAKSVPRGRKMLLFELNNFKQHEALEDDTRALNDEMRRLGIGNRGNNYGRGGYFGGGGRGGGGGGRGGGGSRGGYQAMRTNGFPQDSRRSQGGGQKAAVAVASPADSGRRKGNADEKKAAVASAGKARASPRKDKRADAKPMAEEKKPAAAAPTPPKGRQAKARGKAEEKKPDTAAAAPSKGRQTKAKGKAEAKPKTEAKPATPKGRAKAKSQEATQQTKAKAVATSGNSPKPQRQQRKRERKQQQQGEAL